MTVRHTCNFTNNSQRRLVHSETLETDADVVGQTENSPNQVDFDMGGSGYRFKAHEHQPCGAGQEGLLPIFVSTIPDMTLTINVLMTPYDASVHWIGDITLYGITSINAGLALDTATGIISGTPTAESANNPIMDADGVDSNLFTISVVSA